MKALLLSLSLAFAATAGGPPMGFWLDIQPAPEGPSNGKIKLRVVGGTKDMYWIERSDDNATWEEYVRAYPGMWYFVADRPQHSWFRAKEMTE